MEKQVVERVHELLNTSYWQAEYCHPDKWKGEDVDKCIDILIGTNFSVDDVANAIDDHADQAKDIFEDKDVTMAEAFAICIADPLAWSVLNDEEDVNFPESATFNIQIK